MKRFKGFIPRQDSEASLWNGNYKQEIAVVGATVGMTPAEITDQQDLAQEEMDAIANVENLKAKLAQAVTAKNEVRARVEAAIRNIAARIRTHSMYTDAIGRRLGIVELGSLFNPNEQKPVVSLVAYPGCVNVRFKKYGMKGVTIYSRIKGTLGWEMLGHDYKSPYLDKRSLQEGNQPEIREYMARFFDGHEDIGLSSDVVVIVYGG